MPVSRQRSEITGVAIRKGLAGLTMTMAMAAVTWHPLAAPFVGDVVLLISAIAVGVVG